MSVVEWTDTYGIYHWRILWSSYRKLAWVGFEPTTTEFCSDGLCLYIDICTYRYIYVISIALFILFYNFAKFYYRLMLP